MHVAVWTCAGKAQFAISTTAGGFKFACEQHTGCTAFVWQWYGNLHFTRSFVRLAKVCEYCRRSMLECTTAIQYSCICVTNCPEGHGLFSKVVFVVGAATAWLQCAFVSCVFCAAACE